MDEAPLAGVRILDLSRLLPGPYCTMLLADLGAEVTKVEALPGGDYARDIGAELGGPDLYTAVNRNKRGVAINLRHPAGRDLLLRLAAGSDVFLETFRPGAAARWGIDYPIVRAANPGIVYCSLSGYGQEGPYAGRAGHDLDYLAVSGLLALNGVPGGAPIPPGVQIADLAGGMLAGMAIMSALIRKGRTGMGAYLDVAILDAVSSWAGLLGVWSPTALPHNHTGQQARPPLSGTLPCYNVYACADGAYVALAALEPHFWRAFCEAAGCEELIGRRLDEEAVAAIAAIFARRTRAEWLTLLGNTDVCLEPVTGIEEMLDHPQVRYRGLADATGSVATPFRFAAAARQSQRAPRLGQDTVEVLREAGLADEDIATLVSAGAIGLGGAEID